MFTNSQNIMVRSVENVYTSNITGGLRIYRNCTLICVISHENLCFMLSNVLL